jgi:hypothetical protein
MFFNTILVSAIALTGISVSASPTPRADPRYVQLRLYGQSGCKAENLGELGVYGDSINKCQTFGDDTIRSVSFEYKYFENCTRTSVPNHFLWALYAHIQALTKLQWLSTTTLLVISIAMMWMFTLAFLATRVTGVTLLNAPLHKNGALLVAFFVDSFV